jgi:prepilin-type N-terminal cleavage/methylation domain-containing protein
VIVLERISRARRDESGFTLIELLIVIVILGILAAIVVFAVNGIQDRGTAAACKADVETVTVAAEAYDAQNGHYAETMDDLVKAGLLHSVPSSSTYTVDYNVTGDPGSDQRVSVSSSYCADAASDPSSSVGPGTDPNSEYCVEMASALSKYNNIDIATLDDETFSGLLGEFRTLRKLAPQEDLAQSWSAFYGAFKQVYSILRNSGLTRDDLQNLENGGVPDGLSQEQADQLRNDIGQPMNSDDFQNAGNTLGKYARVVCGLNMGT